MGTYVRFQTSVRSHATRRRLGVFWAAGVLEDRNQIEPCFLDALWDSLSWFNAHLKVPRIPPQHQRSVFWFCSESQVIVRHVWTLVGILEEHDVRVQMLRTADPGMIIYRDEHQVAATPNRLTAYALRV